jgi:hypothetical protein
VPGESRETSTSRPRDPLEFPAFVDTRPPVKLDAFLRCALTSWHRFVATLGRFLFLPAYMAMFRKRRLFKARGCGWGAIGYWKGSPFFQPCHRQREGEVPPMKGSPAELRARKAALEDLITLRGSVDDAAKQRVRSNGTPLQTW